MKRTGRIEAFTLTELLVVLVISAIVIGLAFSVLDLVQNNFRAIKENYANSTELQHLKQQMVIDFNRFHEVQYDPVLQEMRMKNEIDSVKYKHWDSFLIRNLDTLPVAVDQMAFFFLGNQISGGKVDAVKMILSKTSGNYIFIYKKNSAKTYFK